MNMDDALIRWRFVDEELRKMTMVIEADEGDDDDVRCRIDVV